MINVPSNHKQKKMRYKKNCECEPAAHIQLRYTQKQCKQIEKQAHAQASKVSTSCIEYIGVEINKKKNICTSLTPSSTQ